jgi:hypothetical protein
MAGLEPCQRKIKGISDSPGQITGKLNLTINPGERVSKQFQFFMVPEYKGRILLSLGALGELNAVINCEKKSQ